MNFNITASGSAAGLIQDCEDLLGMTTAEISGNSALLKRFTKDINAYYRRVNSWIWEVTSTWEYDDSNWTDLPIATTDLIDGQQDYEIPSTAQKIDRVEVLDSAGNYQLITPIDKSQIKTGALDTETTGMPTEYDLIGRSLFLYPKPDADSVTLVAGLKLYFSRDIDEFTSTDTDTAPGFVSNFHRILSLGASLDYCIAFMPDEVSKVNLLRSQINELREELKNFYSQRHRDQMTRISPKKRDYT